MKIPSEDIPQADVLSDVVSTVLAVSQGAKTDKEIAKHMKKVDRQGRYYRKAAEVLGFIENEGNQSELTDLGKRFVDSDENTRTSLLTTAIVRLRIFQRLIAYLEANTNGVSKEALVEYLGSVTEDIGETMLPRRASTLTSWLKSLGLVEEQDHKYHLSSAVISTQIPILEFSDADEPILPRTGQLTEYQTVEVRTKEAKESVTVYKDQAKVDRAETAHQHLVNLVAKRIVDKNHLPKSNQLIDLATRIEDQDYIFEMKSITEDNAKSQIRKGISQLYEYRYLQNVPDAKLVLVIETQLPEKVQWMHDYLESDRGMMLVWDGDGTLFASEQTREKLNFLW